MYGSRVIGLKGGIANLFFDFLCGEQSFRRNNNFFFTSKKGRDRVKVVDFLPIIGSNWVILVFGTFVYFLLYFFVIFHAFAPSAPVAPVLHISLCMCSAIFVCCFAVFGP